MASSVVYIVFQPGFESNTMKNYENDTPLDYIAPYIKIVKMEVTFNIHFLHLGDLQYDIHLFSTRI